MKNIKPVFIITACLFVSSLSQAQELKTEIAKPLESTVPAPGSRPVLAPNTKPQLPETNTPASTTAEEVKSKLLLQPGETDNSKPRPATVDNRQENIKAIPATQNTTGTSATVPGKSKTAIPATIQQQKQD